MTQFFSLGHYPPIYQPLGGVVKLTPPFHLTLNETGCHINCPSIQNFAAQQNFVQKSGKKSPTVLEVGNLINNNYSTGASLIITSSLVIYHLNYNI